ncbi:MAG: glycosyltransferase family 4 protein [Bacteriovoracaceae bacterium]|jgi:glycosyltransferase involved in cell wall biosynthesis|nr:glycosyltransferase family 4 protein [Bacteriovoracaceae bacterium]
MAKNILLEMERAKNLNTGLGQFCYHLGQSLLEIPSEDLDFSYYYPNSESLFNNRDQHIKSSKLHKHVSALSPNCDIWHSLHQDSQYYPNSKATPYILTIHDLNFLHVGKSASRISARKKSLQKKINRSVGLIFDSEFTKNEVLEHFDIPHDNLEVIYLGSNPLMVETEEKPDIGSDAPFLFSIGGVDPKKNFHVLIPLMEKLEGFNLYIAGNSQTQYAEEIKQTICHKKLDCRVKLLGNVTENQKVWLYHNCSALVFPSIAEGFGFPVLEAFSLKKPAFISRKTSLPELGGDLAYYFDSFDPIEMKKIIEIGLAEFKDHQAELEEKYLEQSKKFNWKTTATSYLNFYQKIKLT